MITQLPTGNLLAKRGNQKIEFVLCRVRINGCIRSGIRKLRFKRPNYLAQSSGGQSRYSIAARLNGGLKMIKDPITNKQAQVILSVLKELHAA